MPRLASLERVPKLRFFIIFDFERVPKRPFFVVMGLKPDPKYAHHYFFVIFYLTPRLASRLEIATLRLETGSRSNFSGSRPALVEIPPKVKSSQAQVSNMLWGHPFQCDQSE